MPAPKPSYIELIPSRLRTNIVRIFGGWHNIDKASLAGHLAMYEAMLHWIWLLALIIGFNRFRFFVEYDALIALLLGCTLYIVVAWTLIQKALMSKHNGEVSASIQIALMLTYWVYISTLMFMLGADSFFTGLSLMSGTVASMALMNRRIAWWFLWLQSLVVIGFVGLPQWFSQIPRLRKETLDAALVQQSAEFWHFNSLLLGVPKAVMVVYIICKLLDITYERKRLITYKAEYDELTGIRNRRSLFEVTRRKLCSGKTHSDMSILMIDLDYFKKINDAYGHIAGDKVLHQVAQFFSQQINSPFRTQAFNGADIGRYGGEEFLIVLPDTKIEGAAAFAESLKQKLAHFVINVHENETLTMTASIGVAALPPNSIQKIQQDYYRMLASRECNLKFKLELDDILKSVIKQADDALYTAKSSGRNCVVVAASIEDKPSQSIHKV